MLGPQRGRLERLRQRLDLEDDIILDKPGETGPDRRVAQCIHELLHSTTRVRLELLVAVEEGAERWEPREPPLEGNGVAYRHGAEIVQDELDVWRRRVVADGHGLRRLGHAQGRGVVFEERRGAPLLFDRLPLRCARQTPLRRREVDGVSDIVGEQHVARTLGDDRGSHAPILLASTLTPTSGGAPGPVRNEMSRGA